MASARVAPAALGSRLRPPAKTAGRRSTKCFLRQPSVFPGVRFRLLQSSRTAVVARAQDYTQLTIIKLKEELRSRGLALSGSKAVLIRRLQDNDAADQQVAAASPADTATLFPDGGPMPEFSEVTKHELLQELRRRGDPILGRSKIDLYDRLQQLITYSSTGFSPGGSPTPIVDDVSGRPSYPVSDVSVESSDAGAAYKAAYRGISSNDFDPSGYTSMDLSSILQALQLPSSGRKAEMIFRLQTFREREGLIQGSGGTQIGPAAAPAAQRSDSPEDVAGIRAAIDRMSDQEVASALQTQGVKLDGDAATLRERLQLMLLVEAREERGGREDTDIEQLTEQARDEVCCTCTAALLFSLRLVERPCLLSLMQN